jgi:hypothetical protein
MPKGKPTFSKLTKVNGHASHSISFCVCMVCEIEANPKKLTFYRFNEWEFCERCINEVLRIEAKKRKRQLERQLALEEELL